MTAIAFEAFPKIPRLFRDIVITEKIDGTNAAVGITPGGQVYAQSRKRLITPDDDNFGFAQWVERNAFDLATQLGPGLHFGEWWGSGIQRGYGLAKGDKRFSLFNVKRWRDADFITPQLGVVPVLYEGRFNTGLVHLSLANLREHGSYAAPGFDKPEGVIVFHAASQHIFKSTLERDEEPKGLTAA